LDSLIAGSIASVLAPRLHGALQLGTVLQPALAPRLRVILLGLPLTSSFLLEYSSEYLNEYSSTR